MAHNIYTRYREVKDGLPESWDWSGFAHQSNELSSNTRSLAHWVMLYEWVAQKIGYTLESQRESRKTAWLERFHHDTNHMRLATMEKQGSSIFYYAQRAFSLSEDYVFRPNDFSRNIWWYMDALVFQPELIPDDILISLWLMQKEDKIPLLTRKSEQQKMEIRKNNIEKKIELIPELKAILASAKPLQVWSWSRYTGRVLSLENGKYLLFQEIKQWTSERKKPNISYVPKVYDDIYSLLRSMEYGTAEIAERLKNWEIILSDLELLRTSWRLFSGEQKRNAITVILQKMKYSKIHQVVSAKNRLMDIEYNHDETDSNRILWARNDIQNLIYSQQWKKWALGYQWAMIDSQITNEERKFGFLKSEFISKLNEMNVWELKSYLQYDWELSNELRRKIMRAFRVLRGYVDSYTSQRFIGAPFLSFVQALENELSLQKNTYMDSLRSLLKVILIIKQYAYKIGIYQIKHHLKKDRPNNSIIEDIDSLVLLLDEKTFLPFVELKTSGQERFGNMRKNLIALKSSIEWWKMIDALMYIEGILDDGWFGNSLAKKHIPL